MFQQTIQDILAIAEAGTSVEDILQRVRTRLGSCEPFECGEIVVLNAGGSFRFVVTPGLGDDGMKALAVLGEEATRRFDTRAALAEQGFESRPELTSLLILRLAAPEGTTAVLVLGHRRAWSFAGAPLARLRTIGNLALRLLVRAAAPNPNDAEAGALRAEVAQLRARISSLQTEVAGLRADRG